MGVTEKQICADREAKHRRGCFGVKEGEAEGAAQRETVEDADEVEVEVGWFTLTARHFAPRVSQHRTLLPPTRTRSDCTHLIIQDLHAAANCGSSRVAVCREPFRLLFLLFSPFLLLFVHLNRTTSVEKTQNASTDPGRSQSQSVVLQKLRRRREMRLAPARRHLAMLMTA